MIMIKDNHIAASGGIDKAVANAQAFLHPTPEASNLSP
jgi:nicotinate-nucleotide pyrophosphorylase